MKKKKVTLSLEGDIYSKFQEYCKENAIMLSKRIEIFMRDFLDKQTQKEKKGANKNE